MKLKLSGLIKACLCGFLLLKTFPSEAGGNVILFDIAATPEPQTEVAMAYNSVEDDFLVVWAAEVSGVRQLFGRIVSDPFTPPSSPIFQITALANDSYEPDLVFNPSVNQYLVAWTYDYSGDQSDTDVYGRIIDADGLDPGSPLLGLAVEGEAERQPAVGLQPSTNPSAGWQYVVAWQFQPPSGVANILFQRRDQQGLSIGEVVGPPVSSFDRSEPEIADQPIGRYHQIVYSIGSQAGDIEIVAFDVSEGSLATLVTYPISAFPGAEGQPDITACGGSWYYNWVGDDQIYTRRMDSNFNLGPILQVSEPTPLTQHRDPAIACLSEEGGVGHAWAATRQVGSDQLQELRNRDSVLDGLRPRNRTYVQANPINQPALMINAESRVLVTASIAGSNPAITDIKGFAYQFDPIFRDRFQ